MRVSSVSTPSGTVVQYSATRDQRRRAAAEPFNSATICGIAVMRHARAETTPIALPTTTPTTIHR